MKRKKLLIILCSTLGLILAGFAAIPLFVDANRIKASIMTQLESRLQRKVAVEEAGITLFTGLGIRLRNIIIADDPKFSSGPFVTLGSLVVRLSLLPLLTGKIEIASIRLDQPVVQLIKNAKGTWNFESLAQSPQGAHQEPMPERAKASSDSQSISLSISRFRFVDGTISIRKFDQDNPIEENRYEHIYMDVDDLSTRQSGRFSMKLQLPGREKRTLQAAGTMGPIILDQLQKTTIDGRIEFSEIPITDFATLFPSLKDTGAEWEGAVSSDVHLQGSYSAGLALDGKILYRELGAKRGPQQSSLVNGELQAKLHYLANPPTLSVEEARLRMPNSTISLSGTYQEKGLFDLKLDSPKQSVDDLLKVASVFGQGPPRGVETSGTGELQLKISGSGKNPRIDGEVKFSDLQISYPGVSEKIALSSLSLNFKGSEMSSNGFQLGLGERTRLEAQIASSFGAEPFYSTTIKSQKAVQVNDVIAIGSSLGFVLPEGVALQNGTLDLQIEAKRLLGAKPDLHLGGQAVLKGGQLKVRALKVPLEVRQAFFKFTGNSANVSDLVSSLASSNLSGKLQVVNFNAPTLVFALGIDQLNLATLDHLVNLAGRFDTGKSSDGSLHTARIDVPVSLHAKHQNHESEPLSCLGALFRDFLLPWEVSAAVPQTPRPTRDPLKELVIRDSSVSIGKVIYDQLLLTQVATKVQMKNKVLELQGLQFQMNQGMQSGTATFDFNGARPRYALSSKLKNVDANEFLSQNTSLKNTIYGKLSCNFDLRGEGSAFDEISRGLKGGGRLALTKGKITSFNLNEQVVALGKLTGLNLGQEGTVIDDAVSDFQVSDGRVSTTALQVKSPDMVLHANGSFGLDKTLDYQVIAELPPATSKKYDDSRQFLNLATATFFKNEQGNVVLPIRMTGVISNPRFALDLRIVQENLRNSFRKGGVKKTLDSLQNIFKSKQPAQDTSTQQSPKELTGTEKSSGEKPPEKKSSPWEDLLKGIMDKAKEKKKDDKQN